MIGSSSSAAIRASVVVVMAFGLGLAKRTTYGSRGQPSLVTDRHSGDSIQWHTQSMCCASAEIQRVAVAAVGNGNRKRAPSVSHPHLRAAWQPRMRGADAPKLEGLTAIRRASVIPAVIDSGGHLPGLSRRQQQ